MYLMQTKIDFIFSPSIYKNDTIHIISDKATACPDSVGWPKNAILDLLLKKRFIFLHVLGK